MSRGWRRTVTVTISSVLHYPWQPGTALDRRSRVSRGQRVSSVSLALWQEQLRRQARMSVTSWDCRTVAPTLSLANTDGRMLASSDADWEAVSAFCAPGSLPRLGVAQLGDQKVSEVRGLVLSCQIANARLFLRWTRQSDVEVFTAAHPYVRPADNSFVV